MVCRLVKSHTTTTKGAVLIEHWVLDRLGKPWQVIVTKEYKDKREVIHKGKKKIMDRNGPKFLIKRDVLKYKKEKENK